MGAKPVLFVTGAGGLLGRAVVALFAQRGWGPVPMTHSELDIADEEAVSDKVAAAQPRVVVNCAAMTNVDECETARDRATAVNADGAGHLAAAAAEVGAEVVHISTDYVFDGTKGDYVETDETNPIQVYGETKLAGEELVRANNARHYILRSAWIYGDGGKNFVSKLPSLISEGHELRAVADQRSSPTYAPDLADAIRACVGTKAYGTYHVVNEGSCSYAEFASHIADLAGGAVSVVGISAAEVSRPAPRPSNSNLVGAEWVRSGFELLRPWRDAAEQYWNDLRRVRRA